MKDFTTCLWHYFDDAKTCLIVGLELLHFTFFTAKPLQGKHIWNSSSCHQGQTTPCSSFCESPVSHVFILICKLLSSQALGLVTPRLPLVFPCVTSQNCDLGVIPSEKVSKNADLRKVCVKGSKCLRDKPSSIMHLIHLTVGQPWALVHLEVTCLKVEELIMWTSGVSFSLVSWWSPAPIRSPL